MAGLGLLVVLVSLAACVWCGVRAPRLLLAVSVVALVAVPVVVLVMAWGASR